MALLDTLKGFGKKVGSMFDRVGPTYVNPATQPKVTGTATVASAGAVAAPTMPKVGPNVVGGAPAKALVPTPKPPAQATVAAAIAPTMNRLAAEAGNASSGSAPMNFNAPVNTPTKTTDLQPRGRSDAQRLRDEYQKMFAPSKAELAARDQLARAEQALANVTAGQTARLADLQYYNPEGVFGGGLAAREGQINRESTLQAIQAQGGLSAAQSSYDRLTQARQQELANFQTIQSLTMPEVVGTPTVNKQTGDVTAFIQGPDGTLEAQVIGNVGADTSFDLQTVIRNEATGQAYAVGTRNGELVAEALGGTAGLAPKASAGGYGAAGGGLYDILDYRTANAALGLVDDFNANPTVKRFSALAEAANQIASVNPNTQNPADHQALVYAFAKALDPESVVREGEYETIKKYAQNVTSRYGGEISNAVNGTGFLSPSAIQNIQQTVAQKYQATLPQYEGLRAQYGGRIDRVAGQPVSGIVLGETAPVVSTTAGVAGPSYDDLPDTAKADGGFFSGVWGFLTGR